MNRFPREPANLPTHMIEVWLLPDYFFIFAPGSPFKFRA